MSDLSLRDRRDEAEAAASRHQDELDRDTRFLSVADLARRWNCAGNTVRAISFEALPYLNLGTGLTRELRRYRQSDVDAYEAASLAPKTARAS